MRVRLGIWSALTTFKCYFRVKAVIPPASSRRVFGEGLRTGLALWLDHCEKALLQVLTCPANAKNTCSGYNRRGGIGEEFDLFVRLVERSVIRSFTFGALTISILVLLPNALPKWPAGLPVPRLV